MTFFNPNLYRLVFIISILVFLISSAADASSTRKTFGEDCDRANRCDSRQSLTCRNGVCDCVVSDSMTFDTEIESCVVLAGERCSFTAVEVDTRNEADDDDKVEKRMWTETLLCVDNAVCNSATGFCSCGPNYFEINNGKCQEKGYYWESCESNEQCLQSNHRNLECHQGLCQCDTNNSLHDPNSGVCLVLAGSPCVNPSKQKCVHNAECDVSCQCTSGYFQTKNGTCSPKRGYGEICESSLECLDNSMFLCRDGRCDCVKPNAYYDARRNECLRRVNDSCGRREGNCVPKAICRSFVCKCEDNYYYYKSTTDGLCQITQYESGCDNSDDRICNHEFGLECNSGHCKCKPNMIYNSSLRTCLCEKEYFMDAPGVCKLKRVHGMECSSSIMCDGDDDLICKDKMCVCDEAIAVYNEESKQCDRLVDKRCREKRSHYNYPSRNEVDWGKPCTQNSRCETSSISQSYRVEENGFCKCLQNSYATEKGLCEIKGGHGESCEADKECIDFEKKLNLVCTDGLCNCRSHHMYNETRDACMQLINHGGNCNVNGDLPCYAERGLVCQGTTCQCQFADHQRYSLDVHKCVSLVKGPCGGKDSLTCVPNSECIENQEGVQRCQCKDGFVPVERECLLGYGQRCDESVSYLRCDRLAPLQCVNGTCQCGDYQMYNKEKMKCRGLVGSKCDLKANKVFCVEGSICQNFRSFENSTEGICDCPLGFIMHPLTRACIKQADENENGGHALGIKLTTENFNDVMMADENI